jgi:methylenetetrahydrofolate dehydrogenase (NADP+)/methenyltetrahydrofolate cyclohydrolase
MERKRPESLGVIADGKLIAERIIQDLLRHPKHEKKHITFAIFNNDPASAAFVARKMLLAKRLGVEVDTISRATESTEEAVAIIEELNDSDTNGIVVQLPLLQELDTEAILNAINPDLDVDLLSQVSIEKFIHGDTKRMPPVAGAVDEILKYYKIQTESKKIVILGQGRLVGIPVGQYFDREGRAVTFVNINTSKEEFTRFLLEADIIVSGIGAPHFLKPDMIQTGVVLIDAGTSFDRGKLLGDVDPSCREKAALLTPVPVGVGPITVAVLFRNLYLN